MTDAQRTTIEDFTAHIAKATAVLEDGKRFLSLVAASAETALAGLSEDDATQARAGYLALAKAFRQHSVHALGAAARIRRAMGIKED